MSKLIDNLKQKARELKKDVMALYLAYRRSDVPWYAKLFAAVVVGYALSPIDLVPDFIPVLGYLDDLLLIPLGISLAVRMIPKTVMEECRKKAEETFREGKPTSKIAGVVIALLWIFILIVIAIKILRII